VSLFQLASEKFRRIDPKWILLSNHSTLLIYGLCSSALQRTGLQIFFSFVCGIALELFIERLKRGAHWRPWDQTKSAAVIVLGLLVFMISRHWWFYGVAAAIAIVGKSLLLRPDGRHIYNPTAITILVMVAFFPNYVFVRGDQFNGTYVPFFVLLILGSLATTRANRWRATVAYVSTSFVTCLLFAAASSRFEFLRLFGPDFGAEGLLFMFLMFTDPRTSPSKPRGQLVYGISIGVLNIYFRASEMAYSQFLALFVVASFVMPLIDRDSSGLPGILPKIRLNVGSESAIRFQIWLKRLFVICLLASFPITWLLKGETWPWSHYPMFASSKTLETATVLRPAIEIQPGQNTFLNLNGEYRGYAFLLTALVQSRRWDDLNRVLKHLYRLHLENEKSVRGRTPTGPIVLIERRANRQDLAHPIDRVLYRARP
jgi:Na+-translocating ferredoxin:NAD+ oxidoreductase RnfD subunit